MEEFVKGLSSGGWWLSVVVVGLALNVASNYLYKWIDRAGASFSLKRSAQSAKRIQQFDREVAKLIEEPAWVPYYFQKETRLRLQSIQLSIFGTIFALFPLLLGAAVADIEVSTRVEKIFLQGMFGFLMLSSTISVLLAYRSFLGATRIRSILNKARVALGIV